MKHFFSFKPINYIVFAEKPTAKIYPYYKSEENNQMKYVSKKDGENSLILTAGSHVRLICGVTGVPPPKIAWLKGHNIIQKTSHIQFSNGKVDIENLTVTDIGTYMCLAESVIGRVASVIHINVGGTCCLLNFCWLFLFLLAVYERYEISVRNYFASGKFLLKQN